LLRLVIVGTVMHDVELYRECARICLGRASLECDDAERARLIVLACSWRTLAQQALAQQGQGDREVDAGGSGALDDRHRSTIELATCAASVF
jgi:hypothetical protein